MNEDRFRDLFDNTHDIIQLVDLEGKLILVNNAWLKLTGYSKEEVIGKPVNDFVRNEDLAFFINYRKSIITGNPRLEDIILGLRKKDGLFVFLEGSGSLRMNNGVPMYTRGIFKDVTSKLKDEAELKEREQYLQDLLKNAPDAVIVIDEESKILFWNPKAEDLFGWKSTEIIGKILSEIIIPHQHREAHHRGMQHYLATGESVVINRSIEITALNKNGNEFNISLTISRSNQNDKPVFIAFIRDISEKKRSEAELEIRSKQLETSNEQLLQFAHAASHDMKEPVRKILLFLGRIEMEFPERFPEKANTYLSKIENASHRLWNIVEGFLNYSNVNTFKEEFETIHLENLIRNIENDLELIIATKEATIKYSGIPSFKGIPFLIYQLFYNLINIT